MESDVCRVAVYSGADHADVELPSAVAVGVLLPSLCDIVDNGTQPPATGNWRLGAPGRSPLDMSKTLLDNGIRDGDILVLTAAPTSPPSPPALDSAEHLAKLTTFSGRTWQRGDSRGTALIATVVLTGAVGVLAVPGPPRIPHLLLAASAAGAIAAIVARATRAGRTLFVATAFGCALIVAAAFCAAVFGGGARHSGMLLTAGSTAVLAGAGRLTLLLCGLSSSANRDLDPDHDPTQPSPFTAECLTALVTASAVSAGLGVLMIVARPTGMDCALAAIISATLLLRARAQRTVPSRITLLAGGIASATATLVAVRDLSPGLTPWLCGATALAAGTVLWFGYRDATPEMSPIARHIANIVECAALAAIIPLTGWGFGVYGAAGALGRS